ncbi:MAG: hypothetical protein ACFB0G_02385 [Leptolyngbyaceae cyanobacterium]
MRPFSNLHLLTLGTKAFSAVWLLLTVGGNGQSELKVLEQLISSGRSPAAINGR